MLILLWLGSVHLGLGLMWVHCVVLTLITAFDLPCLAVACMPFWAPLGDADPRGEVLQHYADPAVGAVLAAGRLSHGPPAPHRRAVVALRRLPAAVHDAGFGGGRRAA